MKELTDYERGFLEALIDADGCLSGAWVPTDPDSRHYHQYPKLRLSISNNSMELLEKVRKMVGYDGCIVQKRNNITPSINYELRYAHTVMKELLPKLSLIVKENRRVAFIETLNLIKPSNRFTNQDREERFKKIEKILGNVGIWRVR